MLNLGTGRTVKSLPGGFSIDHNCAILDDQSVKCWSTDSVNGGYMGVLGLGDSLIRGYNDGEMCDNLPTVNLGAERSAKSMYV